MEVELKLALDPRDVRRFLRAAPLGRAKPSVTRMDAIYLDTPDCELARSGMALRLRREGKRWVQCLKAGRSGTGGLHSRGEWEIERRRADVDLGLFRDTPLARLSGVETLHDRLEGAFRVSFDRTAWDVRPAKGSRLEVALDQGWVTSGSRGEALCEVEVECVQGDAAHAFDLAESLLAIAALRPSAVTKARRGYRLFRGEAPRPAHAVAADVHAGMSPPAAARAIVGAALDQLQANEEGLLAGDDPEFVHQARVAMRRMRSALRLFRKPIGKAQADRWRAQLARATRALGEARDWDVFVAETLPHLDVREDVARRAHRRQARAREAARRAIRSRRYARVLLQLSRWLASGDDHPRASQTIGEFAANRLARRHKRLVAGLERLHEASVEERHRVRIDAKRLRYVVEGLAPALDAGSARRYARKLSRLQDTLGRGNDAVTGQRLLAALDPPREIADPARRWFAARIDEAAPHLGRLARDIIRTRPFWRHA